MLPQHKEAAKGKVNTYIRFSNMRAFTYYLSYPHP